MASMGVSVLRSTAHSVSRTSSPPTSEKLIWSLAGDFALSTFTGVLGIYATHDVFVAAFLHARGVKTDFCAANWPRFLDSAAIVVEPSGAVRHAFVRAGLSDLACGV